MGSYESSSLEEIEAVLDGISGATSEEVYDLTRGMSARAVAAVAASRADAPGGGGGGGLARLAQTATVTTDANTFLASHVFDLEEFSIAYLLVTLLALTPDGETFGDGSGEIGVGWAGNVSGDYGASIDGVAYVTPSVSLMDPNLSDVNGPGFMDTVGQFEVLGWGTPRFVAVNAAIFDNDSFDVYAGANNPQAQVRFDVEYFG